MAHREILPEKKAQLRRLKGELNPFALEVSIQKQLRKISELRRALISHRLKRENSDRN